jgi:hypothetical protein
VPVGDEPLVPVGDEPLVPFGDEPLVPVGDEPLVPFGDEPPTRGQATLIDNLFNPNGIPIIKRVIRDINGLLVGRVQ